MAGGIKGWPEGERPREKLLRQGGENLTDAELLALIIRTGDAASGTSALDIGRQLLTIFGDLRTLARASISEICQVRGTGPAKAACIKAAFAMAERLNSDRLLVSDTFTAPEQIYHHYHYQLRDRKKEYFLVLLLDGRNRVIREVQISEGTLNQSLVHPREVFNPAVRESAAAIILVHNHPSGDPTPSREDMALTGRLRQAGELMGVKVLDHVIIGDGRFISLAGQGVL
ncbi:MAG TPA: DNA repair protein RadC [Geobacterales bacterium]|nr:DNA repair protein RadC [Geobacterales bacterium]